jgi:hypothetical protein
MQPNHHPPIQWAGDFAESIDMAASANAQKVSR